MCQFFYIAIFISLFFLVGMECRYDPKGLSPLPKVSFLSYYKPLNKIDDDDDDDDKYFQTVKANH